MDFKKQSKNNHFIIPKLEKRHILEKLAFFEKYIYTTGYVTSETTFSKAFEC